MEMTNPPGTLLKMIFVQTPSKLWEFAASEALFFLIEEKPHEAEDHTVKEPTGSPSKQWMHFKYLLDPVSIHVSMMWREAQLITSEEKQPLMVHLKDACLLYKARCLLDVSTLCPTLTRSCIFWIDIKNKERWGRGGLLLLSLSIVSDCLRPHGLQASQSFTVSWRLLKLMSIELMMASNHLILCCPLLLLPSIFPLIRVFCKKRVDEKKEMKGNKKRKRRRKNKENEQTFTSAHHWNLDSLSSVWTVIWEYTVTLVKNCWASYGRKQMTLYFKC